IMLHPYLHEVLLVETAPSITKCGSLLKGIFENCILYGIDVPYYNELLNTIESIYQNIKLDDTVSATLFMDTTMAYLAKYGRMESVEQVLKLMMSMPDYGQNNRHTAICDCYAGYVEYMNSHYQKAKQYYLHGLELLEPFHPVNADLISNLKNNLGQAYLALGDTQTALSAIEEAIFIR
ncbi:MAG: tetratricopeptide repeat protein, partial [Eubacteriales bacterium]|nr:tetratricopeptide repeat protein [Eubacteriales bacterium]